MRDGNSCGYMYLSLFESRPYWPHGHRVNRPHPLQRNGSGRFVCMIYPSRIPTVTTLAFVIMYYFHPFRFAKSSIAKQNLSHCVNAVCSGSPSRIRRVRRISLGITTRPRSSMRRTIPVAFISKSPLSVKYYMAIVCRVREIMQNSAPARLRAGLEKSCISGKMRRGHAAFRGLKQKF